MADGGFFYYEIEGEAADLAQTRQEVLLAVDEFGPSVTYVLRARYQGSQEEFAWVLPVPDTPADVVAHESDDLFQALDTDTRPQFTIGMTGGRGGGCGCAAAGGGGSTGGIVEVEATGQAGIFDYAALTSTGSGSLLDWLNDNGFAVPETAADVLDGYIADGRHFLAVRVREPAELVHNSDGEAEIPPIQFTCNTEELFYPMEISRISAAEETEVVVYIYSRHRAEAANLTDVVIDPLDLFYVPDSPSNTNYETLFAQAIDDNNGQALVTEYAGTYGSLIWPDRPADLDAYYLTRLRTVMRPQDMTLDFEFQNAPTDESVDNFISLESSVASASEQALTGGPFVALLTLVAIRKVKVRRQRRSAAAGASPG